ncbi:elongation of very long chain fatty acids protein F [Drosophila mojavensis]|uniref:elongation of very long chain fatty acids protein F n=1 Tax=Drosophila mojavensis TaxID=7230 RepID=UPI0013EEE187|nr:elongation of very long chain fatty acids protein F [Drosophila mojavensis]
MKFLDKFELPRADPGTKEFPILDSPWPSTLICLGYLLFTLKLGPIYMRKRQPYNVKAFMLVYNIVQVIYNGIMFSYGVYRVIINPAYDNKCMESFPLDHPLKPTERWATYIFFLNKLLDLMDTVFFVLRKSYKQITTLHLYHHVIMVYGPYWVIRMYGTGGQYAMMGFFNSFVHTVMYSYYFISALYPELKGSLWWKKYITLLQLAQFILLFFQPIHVLIFNPTCGFPMGLHLMQLAAATSFIIMFSNFYYHAYIKPKTLKTQ